MTTYYVDFAAGADTNSGTSIGFGAWQHSPGDANATDNPAGTSLSAGDTVIFKGGVEYLGQITVTWSGADGNPITFDGNSSGAWGSGRAILDGEGDTLSINARQRAILSDDQSYLVFDNFEVRNLRYIYQDAFGQQAYALLVHGDGTGIEISNCWFHDIMPTPTPVVKETDGTGTSTTEFTFTDTGEDFTPYETGIGGFATHKIWIGWSASDRDSSWGYVGPTGPDDTFTVYKDIDMTQDGWNLDDPTGNNGSYFYWIFNLETGAFNIEGAEIINVSGHSEVHIHDNTVTHGLHAIRVFSTGSPISDVEIDNNDVSLVSWAIQCSGAVTSALSVLRVHDNAIHDFGPYVKDIWGWHNDGIFLWGTPGVQSGGLDDVEVYNNNFYGDMRPAKTGLLFMKYYYSNVKIYNNVFASSSGVGGMLSLTGDISPNVKVYNNTFAKFLGEEANSMVLQDMTNLKMKNNIHWIFENFGAVFTITPDATTGFESDYNLLDSDRGTGDLLFDGVSHTFATWFALGVNDQNSVLEDDPEFTNFPLLGRFANDAGTTSRIMIASASSAFSVGQKVEHEYDGAVRTVTDAQATYIDVTPVLDNASEEDDVVVNWGASTDFVIDCTPGPTSPCLNAGTDLSGDIGGTDFNGTARPQGGGWDIGAIERVVPAGGANSTYYLQVVQKRRRG